MPALCFAVHGTFLQLDATQSARGDVLRISAPSISSGGDTSMNTINSSPFFIGVTSVLGISGRKIVNRLSLSKIRIRPCGL